MKLHSPATDRNREPILSILKRTLPTEGTILEIASGSGQHAVYFASHFPGVQWLPSDPDVNARASIMAWRQEANLENLQPAMDLDVCQEPWPAPSVDAIVAINMVHISPWKATLALLRGASQRLSQGQILFLYGPYHVAEHPTAPSNIAFDESLRARQPEWGLRHLDEMTTAAMDVGLRLSEKAAMPAHNLSLIFKKI